MSDEFCKKVWLSLSQIMSESEIHRIFLILQHYPISDIPQFKSALLITLSKLNYDETWVLDNVFPLMLSF